MNALKAQWKVTAGIIMGQPMDEHLKIWLYTCESYESDKTGETSHYHDLSEKAHSYASHLSNPGIVNWVTIEFIWL